MSLFLKDEAYEQLVQMIDDGKFEYDKKYSLNQIAIELNMSKTPVRDAIQKLADEKRFDILPSRGIQLHMPTDDEVKQHYAWLSLEVYQKNESAVSFYHAQGFRIEDCAWQDDTQHPTWIMRWPADQMP